jgi:hypothetical protein
LRVMLQHDANICGDIVDMQYEWYTPYIGWLLVHFVEVRVSVGCRTLNGPTIIQILSTSLRSLVISKVKARWFSNTDLTPWTCKWPIENNSLPRWSIQCHCRDCQTGWALVWMNVMKYEWMYK